jgi:hypothetical protein
MAISASVETSWRIRSMGKSGERSSGPTGSPVPGCSTGCGRFGMSAAMLYQRSGIALSGRVIFVSVMPARITPPGRDRLALSGALHVLVPGGRETGQE